LEIFIGLKECPDTEGIYTAKCSEDCVDIVGHLLIDKRMELIVVAGSKVEHLLLLLAIVPLC
jgi:hypothetical protein